MNRWDKVSDCILELGSGVKSATSILIEVAHCDVCYLPTMLFFFLSIFVVLNILPRPAVALSSNVYLRGRNQANRKSTFFWSRMRSGPPLKLSVQSWRVLGSIVLRDEACSYHTAVQSSPAVPNSWTLQVVLVETGETFEYMLLHKNAIEHNCPLTWNWKQI